MEAHQWGMTPAEALAEVARIEAAGAYWEDEDFRLPEAGNENWELKRLVGGGEAEEVSADGVPIFPANYAKELHDVKQGQMQDCFLMVSMAALPLARIQQLFLTTHIKPAGVCAVQFCCRGEWRAVVINDTVWHTAKGKPAYSSATAAGAYWPMLLEKAYAKFYNFYEALDGGNLSEAWYDLTGLPSIRQKGPDSVDGGRVSPPSRFQICGSVPLMKNNAEFTKEGLRVKHAYVVERLNTNPVLYRAWDPHQTKKDILEKVKGPYRYDSNKWTPELKKQAGVTDEDAERGYLYLSQAEYENGFQSYTTCVVPDVPHQELVSLVLGEGTDGGNSAHYTFRCNHVLQVLWDADKTPEDRAKPRPLWVTTNQEEQRGKKAAADGFAYSMCGCTLVAPTTPPLTDDPTGLVNGRFQQVGTPSFVMQRTYSTLMSVASAQYIVVSTDEPGQRIPMHLTFQAAEAFKLKAVDVDAGWHTRKIGGEWTQQTAAGFQNFAGAPQYKIAMDGEGDEAAAGGDTVHFVLRQLPARAAAKPAESMRTKGKYHISLMAYKRSPGVAPGAPVDLRISPQKPQFANYAEATLSVTVAPSDYPLTIIPVTGKAAEKGAYEIFMWSRRKLTVEATSSAAAVDSGSTRAAAAPGAGTRKVSATGRKPAAKAGAGRKPSGAGAKPAGKPAAKRAAPGGALGVVRGMGDMYAGLE